MRTSYSALETFKQCPLKYKYQDIDKIRAPKGPEAVFGNTIHLALKYMFERSPLYPTVDQVADFFKEKWLERRSALKDFEDYNDAYLNNGIEIIKRFYKKNQPWNFNVVDLESHFELELEDLKTKEKHVLAGNIDRIDKDNEEEIFEIIDYKTSRKMPSQDSADKNLQLAIYQIGIMKRWPNIPAGKIKLSLYYLPHNEKISSVRSEEQLKETKGYVLKTIGEIEEKKKKDDFPATPSALCDWCGYKKICPMWKHLYSKFEAPSTKSQTEIEEIIKEYFELKDKNDENDDRMAELKAILSSYMEEQKLGRVFGEEGYITKKLQERVSYDFEKVKSILEKVKKWEKILEPDEKKLTALLPSLPSETRAQIEALQNKKQFYTLTASKKKIKKENGATL